MGSASSILAVNAKEGAMDTQVSELIDRIKSEGVEQAEKQAEQIVAAAEERAQAAIEKARQDAAAIVAQAEQERAKQETAGKEAVRQAARDTVLSVQAQLTAIFKQVIESSTGEAMNDQALQEAVMSVISSWSSGEESSIDVVLSESDLDKVEAALRGKLVERLGEGVEIKASSAVAAGFRIASRETGIYYDFSSAAIADALASYVTPRLGETIREAAKEA